MDFWTRLFFRHRHAIVPIGIIACLVVILVPLPPFLLDILLSANIAIAVVILLTTIYIEAPLEFNIFPAMLVATTLSRLVLNLATTRLILTRAGTEKLDAAGGVIRAFGEFERKREVPVDVHVRVERVVLKDHSHPPLVGSPGCDVDPGEANLPAIDLLETGD